MSAGGRLRLTPTARLARALLADDARRLSAAGRQSWTPEPVLTFNAWIQQLWQDHLLLSDDQRAPLNSEQSLALWQRLVADEVFIGDRDVATLAQKAWRRWHEYQLAPPEQWATLTLTQDTALFQAWADRYRAHCAQAQLQDEWGFAAQLPALLAHGNLPLPAEIELTGFDLPVTPIQGAILAAATTRGCSVTGLPTPHTGTEAVLLSALTVFETPGEELESALLWARSQLEADGSHRMAIVVPDLASRVAEAERLMARVLSPTAFQLAGNAGRAGHISLGKPLNRYPLVADALALLDLAAHRISHPEATALLRSPWLPGCEPESAARGQALARWARKAPYQLTWNEFEALLEQHAVSDLRDLLSSWHQARAATPDLLWPSGWTRYWQNELSALGFGHGQALASESFQVLARWHELLERFGSLDSVLEVPLTRSQALKLLRDRSAATVFRQRNPGAAIEVLGVEEALGSRFDAAWLTSLDQNTWPGTLQREPLLPLDVQATVPKATVEGSLHRAQAELAALQRIAPKVCGSYATGIEETPVARSGLVSGANEVAAPGAELPAPAPMAPPTVDAQGPALGAPQERGGSGLLRHQSDCPFRAFAQHRLGAPDARLPRPGLAPVTRGSLTHKALETLWDSLRDSSALAALDPPAQAALAAQHARRAVGDYCRRYRLALTASAQALEAERIASTVNRWLNYERERPPFTVADTEAELTLQFGNLTLKGIVDRIDELEDGRRLIIDYKSSTQPRSDWLPGKRMPQPQLPAYLLSAQPPASGIAFAIVRAGLSKFVGLADADTEVHGINHQDQPKAPFKEAGDWQELTGAWQTGLQALADGFGAGDATVTPRQPAVCQYCHLKAVCRISERSSSFSSDELDDADD